MEKIDCRWVIQTKEQDIGNHQVIETHTVYMHLTEEQIQLMYDIFNTSDKVHSAICGRKKES